MSKRAIKKPGMGGGVVEENPIVQPSPNPSALELDWRTVDLSTLSAELRTYASVLDRLLTQQDDYVLIKGEHVIGVYPTRELAIKAAIDRFGSEPVLVKRIVSTEPVLQIGHVVF